jgi:hypothetical protein
MRDEFRSNSHRVGSASLATFDDALALIRGVTAQQRP